MIDWASYKVGRLTKVGKGNMNQKDSQHESHNRENTNDLKRVTCTAVKSLTIIVNLLVFAAVCSVGNDYNSNDANDDDDDIFTLCRLYDDNRCIISSRYTSFHRYHHFTSVPQVSTTFSIFCIIQMYNHITHSTNLNDK